MSWKSYLPPHALIMARPVSTLPSPNSVTASISSPATFPESESADSLTAIAAEISACRACRLCENRTLTVPGEGSPHAKLLFVGEGPGENEDLEGRPFVGKAGQLLDKMIQAMGMQRSDVFIANVVKCRPPGNRNPEQDEIAACAHFLERQLALLRPTHIIALGKFAAQTLLKTETPISRLRGKFAPLPGHPEIQVMPTFHPSFLLRNPDAKKEVWEDLKQVIREFSKDFK